jgi:hypothetical protein
MNVPYKTSQLRLAALSLIALITTTAALTVHNIEAIIYYNLNSIKLQTAAYIAVVAGVRYLPDLPGSAIQIADTSVRVNGVLPSEIESTRVSPDHLSLTIALRRKLPAYIALLAFRLPSKQIVAVACATKRDMHSSGDLVDTAYLRSPSEH